MVIWRIGGGSITRRSLSPKPHARAAMGCCRIRMVYWGGELGGGGLKEVSLHIDRIWEEGADLGPSLNNPDICMGFED